MESFYSRALPSFLESTVFWFYLNYFGLTVKTILETPLLPTSSWDPDLKLFACSFIADYIWRRFLSVGNCIDPAVPLIFKAQGKSRGDFWPVFISCTCSGLVVYFVSEAISPVSYAFWHRRRGLLACFVIEFVFDFAHQARNAAWTIIDARLKRLEFLEKSVTAGKSTTAEKSKRNDASDGAITLTMHARGIHATASFITASLVAFGSHFSTGGPMLNLSYTLMTALMHRDWTLLALLGTANLLSAYLAGLYVAIDIEAVPNEHAVSRGLLSPAVPHCTAEETETKKSK